MFIDVDWIQLSKLQCSFFQMQQPQPDLHINYMYIKQTRASLTTSIDLSSVPLNMIYLRSGILKVFCALVITTTIRFSLTFPSSGFSDSSLQTTHGDTDSRYIKDSNSLQCRSKVDISEKGNSRIPKVYSVDQKYIHQDRVTSSFQPFTV